MKVAWRTWTALPIVTCDAAARREGLAIVEGPPIAVNGQPVTDYKHGYLLTPAYLSAPQVGLPILGLPVPPALAVP